MKQLFDNRTGKIGKPITDFDYRKSGNLLVFEFVAYESSLTSYSNINNDKLYEGDVVEVFLDIGEEGYYEFEVAPNGATFIARINNLVPTFIENNMFKSEVEICDDTYKVKMTIDLSKFKNIKEIKFNAFRIETKGIEKDYILQAYSPTLCGSFHKRDKFVSIEQ